MHLEPKHLGLAARHSKPLKQVLIKGVKFKKLNRLPTALFLCICSTASLAKSVAIDYHLAFDPKKKKVHVEIKLPDPKSLSSLDFNIEKSLCFGFESDNELQKEDGRLIWSPNKKHASLSYTCKINHQRPSKNRAKAYDALFTEDWIIFRGDDLVPPARAKLKKGAETKARLIFSLPDEWNGVNTGWERDLNPPSEGELAGKPIFFVNNPERSFDRPTGWMIAGKLGTRRVKYTEPNISRIAVSAPTGSSFKQMDVLTFLQFAWPELTRVCGRSPEKLLVVGGDDPMWRGGLSAGNSFFMHANRPLVSENGTSTLLHELFHMCTGIRGKDNADWIAEGLAEFYSLEILHRAGGLNEDRYARSLKSLRLWASSAGPLAQQHSKGATTAKAVLVFVELNHEIQKLSDKEASLDDLVHILIPKNKVGMSDLEAAFKSLTGKDSESLANLSLGTSE